MVEQPKLLIVTRDLSYPGGTEVYLSNYIRYLLAQGLPVQLLETDSHGLFSNNKVYSDLIERGLRLVATLPRTSNLHNLPAVEAIRETVIQGEANIVHSFLFYADLASFFAKTGRDLLSDTQRYPSVRFNWVSSKFNEFSLALEDDSPEAMANKHTADYLLEPVISTETDWIVCASSSILRKWEEFNKNVQVIPCTAISETEFASIQILLSNYLDRFAWNLDNDCLRFITTSRLVLGKGLESTIAAFLRYNILHPQASLTVVGEGPLEPELRKIANDSTAIKFAAYQPRERVLRMLTEHDVFCLFSESEGLSLATQEAMAVQRLVLVTKIGGLIDLVTHLETGVLVDKLNTSDLVDTLESIHKLNPNKINQIRIQAADRIKSNFLNENSFQQNIAAYKRLLNG